MGGSLQESDQPPLPPVFAAMAAQDEAVAAHASLVQRLAVAMQEGTQADEQLRRTDPDDERKMLAAARRLATAVAQVQNLAWREELARSAMQQALAALGATRLAQNRTRLEQLRIELEIDAASIWDLAGQFEAQVRARLDAHGQLAAEMEFVAAAIGEQNSAVLSADMLTPALSASGPELWNALAGGVRQRHDQHQLPAAPAAPPPAVRKQLAWPAMAVRDVALAVPEEPITVTPRFDFARPAHPPPARPQPPARASVPAPLASVAEPEPARGRLDRMLSNLAQIVSRPPKKRSGAP